MNEAKAMRAIMLAQAEEMGIEALVKQHEARLAGRFIQQPTEQDLAAYGMAIAIVAMQVEPAPSEVELQPTAEQMKAGIASLWDTIPGAMDHLCQEVDEEEQPDLFSDTVVFVWQAMIGARNK